jgi:hypothetical protein
VDSKHRKAGVFFFLSYHVNSAAVHGMCSDVVVTTVTTSIYPHGRRDWEFFRLTSLHLLQSGDDGVVHVPVRRWWWRATE